MEANHEFKVHGGEESCIPCLNDSDEWCKTKQIGLLNGLLKKDCINGCFS
jgi:hypothetical protein